MLWAGAVPAVVGLCGAGDGWDEADGGLRRPHGRRHVHRVARVASAQATRGTYGHWCMRACGGACESAEVRARLQRIPTARRAVRGARRGGSRQLRGGGAAGGAAGGTSRQQHTYLQSRSLVEYGNFAAVGDSPARCRRGAGES